MAQASLILASRQAHSSLPTDLPCSTGSKSSGTYFISILYQLTSFSIVEDTRPVEKQVRIA